MIAELVSSGKWIRPLLALPGGLLGRRMGGQRPLSGALAVTKTRKRASTKKVTE